jgi:hypothetical protein
MVWNSVRKNGSVVASRIARTSDGVGTCGRSPLRRCFARGTVAITPG